MSLEQASHWLEKRDDEELEAADCIRSLASFVRRAWQECDPKELLWGWHIEAMCKHLQAVTNGDVQNLIINIPPGHAKSMVVSVLWPAWVWIKRPEWKALCCAYDTSQISRDMVKRRELMRGEWYTKWFRHRVKSPFDIPGWEFSDDQDTKTFYKNTRKGEFTGVPVGNGTGKRGDCVIIDDPTKAGDAHSKLKRDRAIAWKTETMSTRFNDKQKAQQVLVMQRLHENDLTGYLLKNEPGKWQHLNLMSEFDPARRTVTKRKDGSTLFVDPRTHEGDLLFPSLFPREVLDDLKKRELGSYGYAGQHQQLPVPAGGGILKREYFAHRWYAGEQQPIEGLDCHRLPPQFDLYAMFTDAAFKKLEDSDLVATGLFGLKGSSIYLLDLVWERMTFTETVASIVDMRNKWSRVGVSAVYVEDKANGTAVLDVLKNKIPGMLPVNPDGGKESRIVASSTFWEAGNVILPLDAPWVADFITEAVGFPKASHDDAIDMCAYATHKLLGGFSRSLLEALGSL